MAPAADVLVSQAISGAHNLSVAANARAFATARIRPGFVAQLVRAPS